MSPSMDTAKIEQCIKEIEDAWLITAEKNGITVEELYKLICNYMVSRPKDQKRPQRFFSTEGLVWNHGRKFPANKEVCVHLSKRKNIIPPDK
jgi:hypothetical protein